MAKETPSSGGPHNIITITQQPITIPVAARGSFRRIVSKSITPSMTKGMHRAANKVANAKSNA